MVWLLDCRLQELAFILILGTTLISLVVQQQKVIEWQLAYPSGTADECQEWLREAGAKRAKTNDNGCADVTS